MHKDLKSYVYIYVDTTDELGKTCLYRKRDGNRCFAHLSSTKDDEKSELIRQLDENGELRIDLLAWGLDSDTALKVEAAAIDLIGVKDLLNQQRGHHSAEIGRVIVDDFIARKTKTDIKEYLHDCILIKINKLYRVGMSPLELYEATRGIWRVSEKSIEKVEYAFSIYEGVVQEVYEIANWFSAGSTFYATRDDENFEETDRWEFVGKVAKEEVRSLYRYKLVNSLFNGSQNPIAYVGPSFEKNGVTSQ